MNVVDVRSHAVHGLKGSVSEPDDGNGQAFKPFPRLWQLFVPVYASASADVNVIANANVTRRENVRERE